MTTAFKQLTIVLATDRAVTDKKCVGLKGKIRLLAYYLDGIRLIKYKRNTTMIFACDEMKSKHSSYGHSRHSSVQS